MLNESIILWKKGWYLDGILQLKSTVGQTSCYFLFPPKHPYGEQWMALEIMILYTGEWFWIVILDKLSL